MEKQFTGKRIGIIGRRNIGSMLEKRLKTLGAEIVFTGGRGFEKNYSAVLEDTKPDAVGLAISTEDEGESALFYILKTVAESIPIVTCEKGAVSYHMKSISKHMSHIHCSASVGGGTKMLPYLVSRRLNGKPVTIDVVINGTLNYVLWRMQEGATLAEACIEAQNLRYAEPGSSDFRSLLNGELKDVVMKICALYNIALAEGNFLSPSEIGTLVIGEEQLNNLASADLGYRVVVRFSNHASQGLVLHKIIHPIDFKTKNGWRITAGLREMKNNTQQQWIPPGVNNAIRIVEGEYGEDGRSTLTAPGAGIGPTTSVMISDFKDIFGL